MTTLTSYDEIVALPVGSVIEFDHANSDGNEILSLIYDEGQLVERFEKVDESHWKAVSFPARPDLEGDVIPETNFHDAWEPGDEFTVISEVAA